MQFPVYDFRYRADPDSPFCLYDCLVPALKKHVRVPEPLLPTGYGNDIKLLITYNRERLALKRDNIRDLKA